MLNGAIDILIADTALRALIGKDKQNDKYKVYAGICPQPEQHPYLVLRISSQEPIECKDITTDYNYSFAVYCYAGSYKAVSDISDAVKLALDLYSGTIGGVEFDSIRFSNLSDGGVEVGANVLFTRTITFDAVVHESQAT